MKVADIVSHAKELGHILNFMSKRSKIRYFTGLSISTTIQSLFLVSFSLVVQGLVDFAVTQDTSLMYRAIFILAGSLFLVNFVAPFFSYMFRSSVELTMADIRERLFVKLCKLRSRYLEQTHNGDILSRMNNDVTTLEVTYTGVYFVLLLQFVFGVGSLVTMFVVHWPFACASLAILLVSFAISARFVQQIRTLSEQSLQLLARMTGKFSDFIGGIQLVKLFHIQPIYAQYASLNEQVTRVATQTARKNGMLAAVNYFVSYVTFCGIIAIGSLLYTYGLIGMGTVAALAVLQINLTHAIMNFGTTLSMAQNSLAGAQRLQQLLDEQEEPEQIGSRQEDETSFKTLSASSPAMVEFQSVDFSYLPGKKVLSDVSLRVAPGQIAAIVGSSGSGKSTLIKLLLGFYPIDGGELLIQGKPLGHYTLDELRARIAYVPQDAFLFSGTIEENIRYGNPQATEEEIIEAAKAAHAHHFIEELPEQYRAQVGERGKSLSGGQRQRIAIARALLKNAPILLLDEATSALDSESEYWVQQALNQLMEGRTTILIAHQLSTVEKADLIMVMNEGNVVEQGTYRELLERGAYFVKLYGSTELSRRG
ncbi:ATP-binding cassette, subfamily B [Paenibacillus algorifonticola]|uniref:ATP-binding cassette, subfamily B n=1 Tax=Paenibacillus algorifonticola TaxID=684063 RepID=A0A1I2HE25_9BACL|nr:ABC transporter ATP-binding protein [Paenibacillus algorifonticola]SFF28505.1 ATP-binding cassette, subfamily B [Paenibacillus algorifonticola]